MEPTQEGRKRFSPVPKPLAGSEARTDQSHSSPLCFQLLPYNPIPLQNAPSWKTSQKRQKFPSPNIIWNSANTKNSETNEWKETQKELNMWISTNTCNMINLWFSDLKQNPTPNWTFLISHCHQPTIPQI